MSLWNKLFRRKRDEVPFDPDPGVTTEMPTRPYRVLHAELPFYSDPECREEVQGARLVVLQSEDSRQDHKPIECMPTRMKYEAGQLVCWELNNKKQWEEAWYRSPQSGDAEKAFALSVEFNGKVVAHDSTFSRASSSAPN